MWGPKPLLFREMLGDVSAYRVRCCRTRGDGDGKIVFHPLLSVLVGFFFSIFLISGFLPEKIILDVAID